MSNVLTNGGVRLSVVAGIFATIGSLFGKLAGGVYFESLVSSFLKLFLLVIMVVSNTIGCTMFVKGLQGSGSSLPITVTSAATNYFCSALIGFLVFGESTSLMWWCGTSLVLLGLILICCTPAAKTSTSSSAKDKVLPGLYVGNYRDSKDPVQLERFDITHILAIHDAARQLHPDKHYLCILAADTPDQNLSQYFSLCNDFIHAARLRGGNVLIHCLAGMSRSVTVAVAYIMSITNLSWKEALKVVRVGRAVANPNVGFQRQLEDFESSRLQEERRRLKERFPSLALAVEDAEACRTNLSNYETLALAREVCEGKCAMGRTCPTGLCRLRTKRTLRRKSSTSSTGSLGSGRTPPQTPRLLPSAPPSPALPRSASVMSATARPRSGPAGLLSYTGSAPPSRAVSRVDLSAAVACSSSSTSLYAAGRANSTTSGSNWRISTACSAPETPNKTPPISPMHIARRSSARRAVESPSVTPIDTPPDSPKFLTRRGGLTRRTT